MSRHQTPSANPAEPSPAEPSPDPTPPARCVFLVGRGGHGKTFLLRWLAERAFAGGRDLRIADGDRMNRVLPRYFDNVDAPASVDEATVMRWLEARIEQMVAERFTLVVDLGGGDQVLKRLAHEIGLANLLEENGITSVILHLLGPETESLAYLSSLERPILPEENSPSLFAPARTILVINQGLIPDPNLDPVEIFAPVVAHRVFKAALARGAKAIVMPALGPALDVNRRQLSFAAAAAGKTQGDLPPLGLSDRQRIKLWQRKMEANFATVAEWLP